MKNRYLAMAAIIWSAPAIAEVRIAAPPVVSGYEPTIRVNGLAFRQPVRIHLFRMFSRWVTDDPTKRGGWHSVPQPLHAWADVRADAQGVIDMRRVRVTAGTYRGADPYGLMWSGRKLGDPLLAAAAVPGFDVVALRDGENRIVVTHDNAILAQAPFGSVAPPGLVVESVAKDVLNGVFAAPADGRRHPAIICSDGRAQRRCAASRGQGARLGTPRLSQGESRNLRRRHLSDAPMGRRLARSASRRS